MSSEALLVDAGRGCDRTASLQVRLQWNLVGAADAQAARSIKLVGKSVVRRWVVENKIQARGLLSFGKERQGNEEGRVVKAGGRWGTRSRDDDVGMNEPRCLFSTSEYFRRFFFSTGLWHAVTRKPKERENIRRFNNIQASLGRN